MVAQVTSRKEIEARRERVLQMRLMKMNVFAMADALNVSVATISRDLMALKNEWREHYDVESFDAKEAVGEAIANYQFCEARAMREYLSLERASESTAESVRRAIDRHMPQLEQAARAGHADAIRDRLDKLSEQVLTLSKSDKQRQRTMTYAKLRCLQQIRESRIAQMDLLQDLGMVNREQGHGADVDRRDARAIKRWMDDISVKDAELISDGERKYLTEHAETKE